MGYRCWGAPKPVQDFGGGDLALAQRLEVDHQASGVDGGIGANPVINRVDVRIGHDNLSQLVHAIDHCGIGNVLACFGGALDGAVVLLGEETLRDHKIKIGGSRERPRHHR